MSLADAFHSNGIDSKTESSGFSSAARAPVSGNASRDGSAARETDSFDARLNLWPVSAHERARLGLIRRHRRALMEMVAHDIRSPLMSAEISMDIVEELHIFCSSGGFALLQELRVNLSRGLSSAKCLLDSSQRDAFSNTAALKPLLSFNGSSSPDTGGELPLAIFNEMSALSLDMRESLFRARDIMQSFELLEEARLGADCRKHLRRARSGVERGIALIEAQLAFEELRQGSMRLKKASDLVFLLVDEALSSIKTLSDRKRIRLINNCGAETVTVDKNRILQVLINYLSNAIKFSPEGESVVLCSRSVENMVRIYVSDRGPGVSEERRPSLFKRFLKSPLAGEEEGYGLGLFICRLIVEAHGGRVGFDNVEGTGCSFWFEIPR